MVFWLESADRGTADALQPKAYTSAPVSVYACLHFNSQLTRDQLREQVVCP